MHNDINTKRTELANQMAAAGAALLDFTGTACAMAAIPDTEPQQYVAAGTPENIAAILPATICPQRRQKHGDRPTEPLQFDSPAATSGDAPADLQQLKELAMAATPGPWASGWPGIAFEDAVSRIYDEDCHTKEDAAYIAAANPAVVLGLIARIESTEAPAPSRPTEISGRLRQRASEAMPNQDDAKLMLTAADECDRFYGGMMAWKKTAQKKDADWNAERMARVDERCAARAVPPATASGDELAAFEAYAKSRQLDIDPAREGTADRYMDTDTEILWNGWQARAAVSAATKPTTCTLPPAGWSCTRTPGHEGPCAAVPTEVCADDYTPEQFSIYQHGVEDGKLIARGMERYKAGIAARDAATKPTADLSGLQRYGEVAEADGSGEYVTKAADGEFVKFCDVQSLLATKPAAAPAVPEKWINFVRNLSNLQPEVYTSHGLLTVTRAFCNTAADLLAATPAASTTGAAQTADQVRNQALEEAARHCESAELLFDVDELMQRTKKELTAITANMLAEGVRALKRPTTTHNSEAGDAQPIKDEGTK